MELRMIRYGFLAGAGFLIAVELLARWPAPTGPRPGPSAAIEGDISRQVWQVLAEARRITEESA